MPPPWLPVPLAVLPEMVQLVIVVPLLKPLEIPPPSLLAVLPEMVLLVIVIVAMTPAGQPDWQSFRMPPPGPPVAVLPEMVLLLIVNVPRLRMPPPKRALPLLIVRPEMVTLMLLLILKMRKSGVPAKRLRWTVNRFAPGPLIVRFLLITNSSLNSLMVLFAGK